MMKEQYDELRELEKFLSQSNHTDEVKSTNINNSLKKPVENVSRSLEECSELSFSDLQSLSNHLSKDHEEEAEVPTKPIPKLSFASIEKESGKSKHPSSASVVVSSSSSASVSRSSVSASIVQQSLTEKFRQQVQQKIANNLKQKSSLTPSQSKQSSVNHNSNSVIKTTASTPVRQQQKIVDKPSNSSSSSREEVKSSSIARISRVNSVPKQAQNTTPGASSPAISRGSSKNSPLKSSVPTAVVVERVERKFLAPVIVKFFPDTHLIDDAATAVLPSSCSTNPFLSSFYAFYHNKEPETDQDDDHDEVPLITYRRADVPGDESKVEDVVDLEDDETDLLEEAIKESGLPLIKRSETLSDGNCWYDAVADQVNRKLSLSNRRITQSQR